MGHSEEQNRQNHRSEGKAVYRYGVTPEEFISNYREDLRRVVDAAIEKHKNDPELTQKDG